MQALKDDWVLRYGCPTFLSDQGSNVDGKVIRELCETFNIKKRRSSAYHNQGNGFAERSIQNIREITRTLLQDEELSQTSWRQLLKEITFALNTSVSTATKWTPYQVLYGKNAVLPIDVLIDTPSKNYPSDLPIVSAYTSEWKERLAKIYDVVRNNLHESREMMKKQYDKKKNVNTYRLGDMVWLTNIYFKSGDIKKLAPRRSGPWTIELLPNGVKFQIVRKHPYKNLVVHHDRIIPYYGGGPVQPLQITQQSVDDESAPDSYGDGDGDDGKIGESSREYESGDLEGNENVEQAQGRPYPLRERIQRRIDGAISWDAIDL